MGYIFTLKIVYTKMLLPKYAHLWDWKIFLKRRKIRKIMRNIILNYSP